MTNNINPIGGSTETEDDHRRDLDILRRTLANSEASWAASYFGCILNPMAVCLRRDIKFHETFLES